MRRGPQRLHRQVTCLLAPRPRRRGTHRLHRRVICHRAPRPRRRHCQGRRTSRPSSSALRPTSALRSKRPTSRRPRRPRRRAPSRGSPRLRSQVTHRRNCPFRGPRRGRRPSPLIDPRRRQSRHRRRPRRRPTRRGSPRLGHRPTNRRARLRDGQHGQDRRTILPSAPALRAMRRGGGDGSRTTNRPNSMRPLACASAPRKAIW